MASTNSTIEKVAGVTQGSSLATLLEKRADIMTLTQASEEAVLAPAAPGGLSHGERAAIAARMATLNGDETLAAHYRGLTDGADEAIADPASKAGHAPRMAAMLRHVDLVTLSPREASRGDIEALKAAGVTEADIVRLSELVAFVNYQARVIATLRLIGRGV